LLIYYEKKYYSLIEKVTYKLSGQADQDSGVVVFNRQPSASQNNSASETAARTIALNNRTACLHATQLS
jgi:hypothetical protein